MQHILEKQVKELIIFFSNNSEKSIVLSESNYRNLLKGLSILILNSSINIDVKDLPEIFHLSDINKQSLSLEIESRIAAAKSSSQLSYFQIAEILKIYSAYLKQKQNIIFISEQWIEIASYLRVLQMERLWEN